MNTIIAICIPILSGLLWLTYKHPKESRKLIAILLAISSLVTVIGMAYGMGMSKGDRLWAEKTNASLSRYPTNSQSIMNDILTFSLCSIGVYFILVAFSFFFESIHEKKAKTPL